ncbi:MAG: hypothetical protein OXU20_39230 [Myxococcales bacterium]|nr:hypothetical protein [Myxococcales bacterium]
MLCKNRIGSVVTAAALSAAAWGCDSSGSEPAVQQPVPIEGAGNNMANTAPSNSESAQAAPVGPAAEANAPAAAPMAQNPEPAAGAMAPELAETAPEPVEPTAGGPAGEPQEPVEALPEEGGEAEPHHELAMDECGLDTKYPGDEYCILPPPPDKGFQIHVGPDNYDNPGPRYVINPGTENTTNYTVRINTNTDRHFYFRQYRQRPSAHHNIITASGGAGSGFGLGHRIGTSNHLAEDVPKSGKPAPENEGVGVPIEAGATVTVNLHANNFTDEPLLREVWLNFWYVPEDEVKEETQQLFGMGDPTFSIAPGQRTTLGPYSCTTPEPGRLLWLYGHRHASNISFKAWRIRGSDRELIYYGWDWEEPMLLEFTSADTNPAADPDARVEGGWTGILDFQAGDRLQWECDVHNMQDNTLRFTNETYRGEMCIVDGEFVGTACRQGLGGRAGGLGF